MPRRDKPGRGKYLEGKARVKEVFIYWYRSSSIYFNITTIGSFCLGDPLPIILTLISVVVPKIFNFN